MERIDQLQGEMGELGVDALFLRLPENIVLAAGWWVRRARRRRMCETAGSLFLQP